MRVTGLLFCEGTVDDCLEPLDFAGGTAVSIVDGYPNRRLLSRYYGRHAGVRGNPCRSSLFKRKTDILAMITAYFDASGTHGPSSIVAVAGYASTKFQWHSFRAEWKRLLRKEKISVVHMSELESLQGEFSPKRGWTKERREKFIHKAAAIIAHRTRTAVGHVVIKSDWDEAAPNYIKKMFGGPYGWCASECIAKISNWAKKQGNKDGVHFVFEAGTQGHGQIQDMLKEIMNDRELNQHYGVQDYSVGNKSIFPLHAADMLAYEVYKEGENWLIEDGKRTVRPPLNLLIGHHNLDLNNFQYGDRKQLSDWIAWAERKYGSR